MDMHTIDSDRQKKAQKSKKNALALLKAKRKGRAHSRTHDVRVRSACRVSDVLHLTPSSLLFGARGSVTPTVVNSFLYFSFRFPET